MKYGDFRHALIVAGLPPYWKTSMWGAAGTCSQASCQCSIWATRPTSLIVLQIASATHCVLVRLESIGAEANTYRSGVGLGIWQLGLD